MDPISLLEQLAHTAHHQAETKRLINTLPTELKTAFVQHDSHQLREKISGLSYFPDSRTVTHR